MYQWFVAWRYITSRFITFGSFLLVSLSVALLIILLAVMEGFRTEMIERIRGTSTDVKVDSSKFDGLEDYERVQQIVDEVDGVRAACPYVETLVTYRFVAERVLDGYLELQALDLDLESSVGRLDEYIRNSSSGKRGLPETAAEILSDDWVKRRLWEWNEKRHRRAKGSGLARLIRTEPPEDIDQLRPILFGEEILKQRNLLDLPWYLIGQTIELHTISPVTNQPRRQRFVLAGLFKSKDVEQDNNTILMGLEAAHEFLALHNPETGFNSVSGLRVWAEPGRDADEIKESIRAVLGEAQVPFVQVRTWREQKAKILRAVRMEKTIVGILLGMIVVMVGLMLFIILTVQLVERTRDLGVLQSVGGPPRGVTGIYLRIGAGICLTGISLGVVFGVAFCKSLGTIQRWLFILTGFQLFPKDIYYIDQIPVQLVTTDFAFIILPTVLVSFLASYAAAYRAARKDPVQALRYE